MTQWGPKNWDGDKMNDLIVQLVSAATAVTTEAELREKQTAREERYAAEAERNKAANEAYIANMANEAKTLAEHRAAALEEERRYNDAMVAAVRDGFALLAAAVREGNSP